MISGDDHVGAHAKRRGAEDRGVGRGTDRGGAQKCRALIEIYIAGGKARPGGTGDGCCQLHIRAKGRRRQIGGERRGCCFLRGSGNRVQQNADGAAVGRARSTILERARPVLIEAMTHRLVGHYSGDAQAYRPAGELEAARLKDPLVLLAQRIDDEPALQAARDAVDAEVAAALDVARSVPYANDVAVTEQFVGIGPRYKTGKNKGACNQSDSARPIAGAGAVSGTGTIAFNG